MKIVRIYNPSSVLLKKMIAERRGWNLRKIENLKKLREDYVLRSKEFPIFVVADGVTLAIKPRKAYPVLSGAGEIAKIFCKNAMSDSEKMYAGFQRRNIMDIFAKANAEAEKYNQKRGRTKKTINYFDIDYFCATAALAVVKNDELFYGAIGDSRVVLKDRNGRIKFGTRDRVEPIEKLAARKFPHPKPQQKKIFQQRYYRNKIGKDGKLIGYGVIDGEPEALQYIECGKIKIQKGDRLFIFTDGFTPYFKISEFKKLFFKWPANIGKRVLDFTREYVAENLPGDAEKQYRFLYKYASEKSLFAIKF